MLVALDQKRERAVLGTEIDREIPKKEPPDHAISDRYRCLLCDSALRYATDQDDIFRYFLHDNAEECVNFGNMSPNHRLAQEVVSQAIFNAFSEMYRPVQLDIEARVGDRSDFVVSDIRISEPFQVVTEIVYLSNYIGLQRRLKILFSNNYQAMLVFVSDGRVSPERAEHHLRKLAPISIGRFDPATLDVKLGSVINSSQIDPENSSWHLIPDYLS